MTGVSVVRNEPVLSGIKRGPSSVVTRWRAASVSALRPSCYCYPFGTAESAGKPRLESAQVCPW